MRLYHITTPDGAQAIVAAGFRDPPGTIGYIGDQAVWRPYSLRGVLFSNETALAHVSTGAATSAVVVIEAPEDAIAAWELVEEDDDAPSNGGWREWCIPAAEADRYFQDRRVYLVSDVGNGRLAPVGRAEGKE